MKAQWEECGGQVLLGDQHRPQSDRAAANQLPEYHGY